MTSGVLLHQFLQHITQKLKIHLQIPILSVIVVITMITKRNITISSHVTTTQAFADSLLLMHLYLQDLLRKFLREQTFIYIAIITQLIILMILVA